MLDDRITLFTLFGFKVQLDASWVVIALLVTWSLATGYFPSNYENLSAGSYWLMGVVGATGLFLSIIFHEFWHSVIARYYGLPMKGITLFIFGGIAEMNQEPDRPKTEFLMAAAGPLSSVILGFGFHGLKLVVETQNNPTALGVIFGYLAFINWLLAGFNMLPAFPLDGGRILRSALWTVKNDLAWATRIVCRIGAGFGVGLIALGVITFLQGYAISGVWYVIIGMFLRGAAQASAERLKGRLPDSDPETDL
ncbi:MAG: site-2 protease family protein [Desulfuromonadales bacterium]|nr:site-2 protease family protein [Desulfuromonadales bacterium]